jgi:hypothetical protein
MSTAVTVDAPVRAAQIASTPLPAQTSSTAAPRQSACSRIARASSHVSDIGRKTPGSVAIRTGGGSVEESAGDVCHDCPEAPSEDMPSRRPCRPTSSSKHRCR